jgi:hypothetical protein
MLDYYTLALAAVVAIDAAVVRIFAAIAVGVAIAVVAVGLYSSSKIERYRGIGEIDLIVGTARMETGCFRAGIARDGLTKMGHARALTAEIITRTIRTRIIV